jgi:hypothetical protein
MSYEQASPPPMSYEQASPPPMSYEQASPPCDDLSYWQLALDRTERIGREWLRLQRLSVAEKEALGWNDRDWALLGSKAEWCSLLGHYGIVHPEAFGDLLSMIALLLARSENPMPFAHGFPPDQEPVRPQEVSPQGTPPLPAEQSTACVTMAIPTASPPTHTLHASLDGSQQPAPSLLARLGPPVNQASFSNIQPSPSASPMSTAGAQATSGPPLVCHSATLVCQVQAEMSRLLCGSHHSSCSDFITDVTGSLASEEVGQTHPIPQAVSPGGDTEPRHEESKRDHRPCSTRTC